MLWVCIGIAALLAGLAVFLRWKGYLGADDAAAAICAVVGAVRRAEAVFGGAVGVGKGSHIRIDLPVPGAIGRRHDGVPVQSRLQPHGLVRRNDLRGKTAGILLLNHIFHGL